MGALIPQGLAGSPNYFGFLNTFVIPINCESLGEIGYIAYVTPARSSHGQALKLRFISFIHATSTLRNQLFASFFSLKTFRKDSLKLCKGGEGVHLSSCKLP